MEAVPENMPCRILSVGGGTPAFLPDAVLYRINVFGKETAAFPRPVWADVRIAERNGMEFMQWKGTGKEGK